MKRTTRLLPPLAFGTLLLLGACGGAIEPVPGDRAPRPAPGSTTNGPSGSTAPPTGPTGSTALSSCCPIDDHPGCCMNYGGSGTGPECGASCDGMASPGDPGWKKGVDSNGCAIWIEPANPAHRCGEPVPVRDAGPDAHPSVECCPVDAQPACCMNFGGPKQSPNSCVTACDGMASPSDPGWQLITDAYGCKVWQEPANPAHLCGEIPDSGKVTLPDAG